MRYYIGEHGYYEGDKTSFSDVECTKRPSEYHDLVEGDWVLDIEREKGDRIAALQAAYDVDLDRLNKAWLSALIADGLGEAARQIVIKAQMAEIEAQLDTDILNIIMEA